MARHALGKGLSALIREPEPEVKPAEPAPAVVARTGPVEIDIDLIDPNPFQPRTRFAGLALEQLAESIKRAGVIQPIILRAVGKRYQLIAGERRWRAAQRAGLHRLPAIIRDVPDEMALEMTLVENLQREDLNPIEQARAFERLMTEFSMTQEDVAVRTGKERSTIANAVRLLDLEPPIIALLEEGRLSAGHGRALLMIPDIPTRIALAGQAATKDMSVRDVERFATGRKRQELVDKSRPPLDPNTRAAMEELQRDLGTRVTLRWKRRKGPGQLIIEFYDNQQFIALYERLRSH
jgi:ParB family chromosome partitioning protein